jgi:hypothetical protein
MLRPLRPRQQFHRGHWRCDWAPASPSTDVALLGRGIEREPTLSKPTPSTRLHNGEARSTASKRPSWHSRTKPPWHEPMLEAERILMLDLAATQDQAKGVAPSANRKGGGGQTETAIAMPLNALPPPSTDGVDRLYANWQKSMSSPPRNWQSAPTSAGLTQPIARFMPRPDGKCRQWNHLRNGWHHHH